MTVTPFMITQQWRGSLLWMVILFWGLTLTAQKDRLIITPPLSNAVLQQAAIGKETSPHKIPPMFDRRNQLDTLELPFFDDFTTTTMYPDMRRWMDSLVFINSNFPISPPSFGVATFDNLDKWGNAYNGFQFSMDVFRGSDTLTSRPINLKSYRQGNNDVNYTEADSVYLSFFYQPQGRGDRPENRDSFVLQFKNQSGQWVNVWSVNGMRFHPFRQVMVPVIHASFFWEAFQFRFINYTFAMGNLNHVHLDYVQLNRDRSAVDTVIRDVAINAKPPSLLHDLYAMPYRHFLVNPSGLSRANHGAGVRNMDSETINTRFQMEAFKDTQRLVIFPFSANNRNVFSRTDTLETFSTFDMDRWPSTENPVIRCEYRIDPQAGNTTPSLYNSLGNNDVYIREQRFGNYYAYDDGSAEGGIGLSYEGLPPGRGLFALRYQLTRPDTLRGVSFFFNQSLENVSSRPFSVAIWNQIQPGQREVKPLYEMPVLYPIYTDSINGFHTFILDTTIILPAGIFYVGWSQVGTFNLNVGYDQNYEFEDGQRGNPHIFYNLLGLWDTPPSVIKGAPMIRPVLGADLNTHNHIPAFPYRQPLKVVVYPNPFQEELTIHAGHSDKLELQLFSVTGTCVANGRMTSGEKWNPGPLPPGCYFLKVKSPLGTTTTKIMKQ
jgi:hypothetical protein